MLYHSILAELEICAFFSLSQHISTNLTQYSMYQPFTSISRMKTMLENFDPLTVFQCSTSQTTKFLPRFNFSWKIDVIEL